MSQDETAFDTLITEFSQNIRQIEAAIDRAPASERPEIERKLTDVLVSVAHLNPLGDRSAALLDAPSPDGVYARANMREGQLGRFDDDAIKARLSEALQGTGINLVEDKSYPGGVKDLSPVLRSIKDKNPDAFVGFTYPPDTILASRQAKEIGFNPKVFYASVGTAFPLYRNVMTPAGAEGVTGMGSWNSKTSPGAKAYFDAHVASQKKEPDRWASGAAWAGLEILTNAVKQVGLDRKAIRDYVAGTTHKTIIGDIRFQGSENVGTPGTIGQWQNGEFEVVWPTARATAKLNANKAAWK